VAVPHTKSPNTSAGFPRYNVSTSTGNLFVVETDPRLHLINQYSHVSTDWYTE